MREIAKSETFSKRSDPLIEKATTLIDTGRWEDGAKIVEECFDKLMIRKASKSLSWRLAQNPIVSQKLIERFRKESSFLMAGDSMEASVLKEERNFDSTLREHTSDLFQALIRQQRNKAWNILDNLFAEFPSIQYGVGCSTAYQKLHILLDSSKDFLLDHSEFKTLHFWSRYHGSESPVRPLLLPRRLIQNEILGSLLDNKLSEIINIGFAFRPVPGSFAATAIENPGMLDENGLLEILLYLKKHLRLKYCETQPSGAR
jgi:hypothetical protein